MANPKFQTPVVKIANPHRRPNLITCYSVEKIEVSIPTFSDNLHLKVSNGFIDSGFCHLLFLLEVLPAFAWRITIASDRACLRFARSLSMADIFGGCAGVVLFSIGLKSAGGRCLSTGFFKKVFGQ